MAYQNRPAPRRRVGINQLVKFEGNREETTPSAKTKITLERGRCPLPNLLKNTLRERRLRLGAPLRSSSKLIALIKLLLRLRSHARIGVRAAGNKTNEQKGRGNAPEKTFNLDQQTL